uniref:ATP synthase complex subunit 8 n=1 Tax=Polyphemus pediculus TaxID=77662 RepID=A0A7L7S139_9CRUS|nr:ATP synthase F0 subunit 8 [Polyphemus pediculus]
MPQIWPLNWVLLFVFFIITFLVFVSVLHFFIVPQVSSSLEEGYSSNALVWKW